MVAETEASEVAAVEETCRPGFSSNQNLPKPDSDGILHNVQANDLNCSVVLETKDDDIIDNAFINNYVIHKVSTIFPDSNTAVVGHGTSSGASNEDLKDVNRAFTEFRKQEENSNIKGTDGEQFTLECAMSKQNLDANILGDYDADAQNCSEVAMQPETGTPNSSSVSCGDTISDLTVTCDSEVSNVSNVSSEGTINIFLESQEVDLDGQLNDALCSSESMLEFDVGNHHRYNGSMDSKYGSTANEVSLEEASAEAVAKPFNFFIRIPRFTDESLREQIRIAKLNIEQKMKFMEAIRIQIQEKWADSQIQGCEYKNAKIEHRKAWDLVTSKRMEIDSVQSMINKAKNALSIQDIDSEIYNMEHMIQHENNTLKEEKHLVCRIRKLRKLRGELSSNLGSQDEINQALEQREELENCLKVLRKELDILKDGVKKAEAAVVKAGRDYRDGCKKIKELQTQFRAVNEVRQAAYADLQGLRKELREKNKHFFKYKDNLAAANMYASRKDEEVLHRFCVDQVENFMKHWNQNEEFREEYVKFNTHSTVKRLGTLDGRSLGPNEEPLIRPNNAGETVQTQADELKRETTVKNSSTKSDVNYKLMKKTMVNENQKKAMDKRQTVSNDLVSENNVALEKSSEEIELERRAEENVRKEEEAKLKEQRRLEELVKANDARERKKRQAEKEQLRAQLRVLKEAELREKEKEKKLRKKEKQKAVAPDVNHTLGRNGEDGASPESFVEMDHNKNLKDHVTSSETGHRKPNKSWPFAKHGKSKSIPPPLRNRNKKYYRQWLLVGASCVAILVLFWLGNMGTFSKVNLKRRIPPL